MTPQQDHKRVSRQCFPIQINNTEIKAIQNGTTATGTHAPYQNMNYACNHVNVQPELFPGAEI